MGREACGLQIVARHPVSTCYGLRLKNLAGTRALREGISYQLGTGSTGVGGRFLSSPPSPPPPARSPRRLIRLVSLLFVQFNRSNSSRAVNKRRDFSYLHSYGRPCRRDVASVIFAPNERANCRRPANENDDTSIHGVVDISQTVTSIVNRKSFS